MRKFTFNCYDGVSGNVNYVEFKENGSLYFYSCTCSISSYKKCKHVRSILAGEEKYLNQTGIANQQELIERLKTFHAGINTINNVRASKGLPPICTKCKTETNEARQNFSFLLMLTRSFIKKYKCINCGHDHL